MSSKYRHRNGGVAHEGRPEYRNNSPPKNRTSKERQHHFKSIPRHELDAVDHLFDARPSYQDFHSSFVIQNDDRYPNKGRVPPTKLRDSSQHRRKTRERHESEFKSLDMNSPQRQSRMPDWINFNGHNLGKSQLSGIGRSHLNPDEFWRSEQFERSTENVESIYQRRGSHKKRNNKNNSDIQKLDPLPLTNHSGYAKTQPDDRSNQTSRFDAHYHLQRCLGCFGQGAICTRWR